MTETALKLDRLIGDIEDAVASIMTGKMRMSSSSENFEVSRKFHFLFFKEVSPISGWR